MVTFIVWESYLFKAVQNVCVLIVNHSNDREKLRKMLQIPGPRNGPPSHIPSCTYIERKVYIFALMLCFSNFSTHSHHLDNLLK